MTIRRRKGSGSSFRRRGGKELAKSEKAASPVGRSELINIALDLFSQHGFVGTSIRDIANEAGKSVSNMYHYFENKEAIWLAILEKSFDGLPERLATELASRGDELVVQFLEWAAPLLGPISEEVAGRLEVYGTLATARPTGGSHA